MATRYQYRAIVVLPAAYQSAANSVAHDYLDPCGGEDTFTAGLSADGQEPVTCYWSASSLVESAISLFPSLLANFPGALAWVWSISGDNSRLRTLFDGVAGVSVGEVSPDAVLAQCGLKRLVGASHD